VFVLERLWLRGLGMESAERGLLFFLSSWPGVVPAICASTMRG
jgi:hypothetical protein